MEQKNFEDVLSRAQDMMFSRQFNEKVDNIARRQKGKGDLRMLEEQAFGGSMGSEQHSKKQIGPKAVGEGVDYSNIDASKTKLPAAILESFKDNPPIEVDQSMVSNEDLDTITENLRKKRGNIMEMMGIQDGGNTSGTEYTPSGVDYGIIKAIVDECIKRNLAEGSGLLTESAANGMPMFKGMRICEGNRIQMLDSKGNLYEGVLKLKKRAK